MINEKGMSYLKSWEVIFQEKIRIFKNKIDEILINVVQGYGINNFIAKMTLKDKWQIVKEYRKK